MECLSFVGCSILSQWPLAEAHVSPVSQQVFTSSLADTIMQHKNSVPGLYHSAQPAYQRNDMKWLQCEFSWKRMFNIFHHRIPSVRFYNIWLQDIWSATGFHLWWNTCLRNRLRAGFGDYTLHVCFSFQTPGLGSNFHWQGEVCNPKLYKITFRLKFSFFVNQSWSRVQEWHISTSLRTGSGRRQSKTTLSS